MLRTLLQYLLRSLKHVSSARWELNEQYNLRKLDDGESTS
jgi:hypothetical protein